VGRVEQRKSGTATSRRESLNETTYYFFSLVEEMTELKTVKVSKQTYSKLSEIAGELQVKLKRPVSLDEAMQHLLTSKTKDKGIKITDLAGSWDMSDREWAEIKASLSEAWKRWQLPVTEL